MSPNNRVVWSEGLFLRPQHFQQQDRFHEHALEQLLGSIVAYNYGFVELQLDRELLKLGKLGLSSAIGVMPDGTPFSLPDDGPLPAPVNVAANTKNAEICLTLPLRRQAMADTSMTVASSSELLRFQAHDLEVRDTVAEQGSQAPIKVGVLNMQLAPATEVSTACCDLPIARILEKRSDGTIVLDDSFIPPVLDTRSSSQLLGFLTEIIGLLRHRAIALAGRIAQPGVKGIGDISDFLLLQVCNRAGHVFAHLSDRARLHPEQLYCEMLRLAGELSTFGRKERYIESMSQYRHRELEASFAPVIVEIRRTLTTVLDQTAVAIPLIDRGRGSFSGEVPDLDLLRNATFVMAVNADLPSDRLRATFPTQLKIGPVEKFKELVRLHLPGIGIEPMPVAPRQLPFYNGFTYFKLKAEHPFWREVEVTRMLAMHVAGEFPGLTMELWAIRD